MHDLSSSLHAEGVARVERGTGWFARVIAALFRFPVSGEGVPVAVDFTTRGGAEIWRRSFAGRPFVSVQSGGEGREDKLLVERFGPFSFGLALVLDAGRLHLVLRRWRIFGLRLPLFLAPTGTACEYEENGRFQFHVEIGHPLAGLIVRYRGWLKLATMA